MEFLWTVRQSEAFEFRRTARCVLAHEYEVAGVGHQHQPVVVPVAAHLIAVGRQPGIVADGFHLDHAALRHLSVARPALLHLLRRVEAEVGMARALVSKLTNAEYLRVEHRADGIQQVGEAARSSTVPRSRHPMREPDRGRRSTLPLPLSVSCSFPSSLRPAELIPTLAQYRQCVNVSM